MKCADKIVFIVIAAGWWSSTLVFGQNAVPEGFRIVGGSGVRITKPITQELNRELTSSNRMDYIEHYADMLSSTDVTNRMFAIYALGNFQSPRSLEALFAHCKTESNPQAIRLLADSVCSLFPYWPGANQGRDSEKWDCHAVLSRWAKYYQEHGYLGLFDAEYSRVEGDLEAEAMFVVAFAADKPSPDLLSFYKSVLKETSFPKVRDACQKAINVLGAK
jgi:hypothetical protein